MDNNKKLFKNNISIPQKKKRSVGLFDNRKIFVRGRKNIRQSMKNVRYSPRKLKEMKEVLSSNSDKLETIVK